MERGEKRSYDMIEEPLVATYEFSQIELQNLKKAAEERPMFDGVEELDYNTKMSALKSSSFVVSLVSISGTSVLNQSCGAIIETEGNTNTVITSLNLIRKSEAEGAKYVENNVFENLKVIIYADDDNCYLGEVNGYDFFYNLLILKFKSRTYFRPPKFSMIDDASGLGRDGPLRRHSTKAKGGDNVIVLGRYFYEPYDYMAVPGLLSVERFNPDYYDCNELLTIKCHYTRCGDGAPVISTSGDLLGMTFFDLSSGSPLLPINILSRLLEHYKKSGEMRHPSYGFDARNVYSALLPTVRKFHKAFPDVPNGLIVERVFEGHNAYSAGLRVGDVIITCDGVALKSFLELWDLMFEKVGKDVVLQVAGVDSRMVKNVRLIIGEAAIDEEIYRWPRYDFR